MPISKFDNKRYIMKHTIRQLVLVLGIGAIILALCACGGIHGGNSDENAVEITCYLTTTADVPTVLKAVDGQLTQFALPTRVGYTFNGLYTSPEGGSLVVDANGHTVVVLDQPMTLYAQWSAKNCYIIFDAQGGEISSDEAEMTVTYGGTVTKFPNPTREGYHFVGWEDVNGVRCSNGTSVMREKQTFTAETYPLNGESIRLFAVYEVARYQVLFDYNDGTYRTAEAMVEHGQPVPEGAYPTEGLDTGSRRVAGWSATPEGTQPFMGTVKGNMTLYAIWRDYKTFTMNDTVGGETPLIVYRGETVDLTAYEGVIRPGYNLEGWYTQATYSGNPVTEIRFESPDKIYYAKWTVATYALTFDQESAGKAISPITYQMGDSLTLETIQREGLIFCGWSTSKDGSAEVFTTLPATFWGNHVLYAVFEPVFFTVTLRSDGGTLPAGKDTVSLEYGKTFKLPVPEKEGHVFLGWFAGTESGAGCLTDAAGVSQGEYDVAGDAVFYARWEPQQYEVTFNTNGGSEIPSLHVPHGEKLTFPAEPSKAGMIFDGWYDSALENGYTESYTVTGNLTLYAKWVQSSPISSVEELIAIAANPNANYHLTRNIDLGGTEWIMIPEFNGVLNGRGYAITGFTLTTGGTNTGFFGINNGTIKNLTFTGFAFSCSGHYGGIVAGTNAGTIENCSVVDGSFSFDFFINDSGTYNGYAGGIVGWNQGIIHGCDVQAHFSTIASTSKGEHFHWNSEVTYNNHFLGLIAGRSDKSITDTAAVGMVKVSVHSNKAESEDYAEVSENIGAIGHNTGMLANCSSDIQVIVDRITGNAATVIAFGGFVASNDGTITACSASGTFSDDIGFATTIRAGGFVNCNTHTINNCFTSVSLSIKSVGNNNSHQGGFAGNNGKTITNSYCIGNLTTSSNAGKGTFVGLNASGASISKCFSAGDLTMSTTNNSGTFVGVAEGGSSCYKCYYNQDQRVTANDTVTVPVLFEGEPASVKTLQGDDFIFGSLNWSTDIWYIPASGYPVLK